MAPAGLPLVQHSLQTMLEFNEANQLSLERIVRKSSHNPAVLFGIVDRGFIREGYFADLVSIDLDKPQTITSENILYRCGWSPFEGESFSSSIHMTILNGDIVFRSGEVMERPSGQPLAFLQR